MFTDVYKKTTDPDTTPTDILRCPGVWMSVVFHTLMYFMFVYAANWSFTGRGLSLETTQRLLFVLTSIMTLGYIARIMFVKQVYKSYGYDTVGAKEHIDKHFIHWIFIA